MEIAIFVLLAIVLILQIILLVKPQRQGEDLKPILDDKQKLMTDEIRRTEHALTENTSQLRVGFSQYYAQMLKEQSENNQKLLLAMSDQTEKINKTLSESVLKLQESNEKKLEQMRETVDEKLSSTLSKRLDESFKTVGEQLKNVYESLGEMKNLAGDVNNLQRVLTNVKARGTFAEVQLGNILEQTLTADQFERNVSTKGNNDRVEYAVKIPSKEDDGSIVWLPIDSKFPQEDYMRICEAAEHADANGVEEATKRLVNFVKEQAKKIADLYISVPQTTDFAILFLPTEGLYAEVLRRPGLVEEIQTKHRVMICGPTTITAFLNTLSMGFRTIAIDKHAAEVWKVLGATKEQYEKFEVILEKAKKKINEAGDALEQAQSRNSQIQKKLKKVDAIEEGESSDLLLGIDTSI